MMELRALITQQNNNQCEDDDVVVREHLLDRKEGRMRCLEVPYFSGEDPYM